MTDLKISQLPNAATLTGDEYVPIVQNGVTVKALASAFFSSPPTPPAAYTGVISAGAYDSTGKLVRTIYAAESVTNLTPSASIWDNRLDDGSIAPAGSYTVKFLTSSVSYAWDGAVGNTSTNLNVAGFYHGYAQPTAICCPLGSSSLYWGGDYSEAVLSTGKTAKNNLGVTTTLGPNGPVANNSLATNPSVRHVVTDGTNLYWSAWFSDYGATPSGSFVYATKVADDTKVTFSSGVNFAPPDQFYFTYSAADKTASSGLGANDAIITGLAVQTSGNFMFVARGGLNNIHVVNKTTGALAQTFAITKPMALAITNNDQLWVIHGNTPVLDRYSCDGSGNLSIIGGTTISGLSNPLAMAVQPTGDRLLVVDGGSSQTVKAFVNSTSAPDTTFGSSGVFGTVGGYNGNPTVTNTKFMFTQGGDAPTLVAPAEMSYIAFDPNDNSWWLTDYANFRYLHFSSGNSPAYIEQIQFLGSFICSSVCKGDPTRVFMKWLEFTVDYTKPLSPTNGSWTLAKNWGYGMTSPGTAGYNNYSNVLLEVAKLSNGRTYTAMKKLNNKVDILELAATGLSLVVANIDTSSGGSLVWVFDKIRQSDGALIGRPTVGATTTFQKAPVTFDISGNPTWTPSVNELTTAVEPAGWPSAENGFGGVDQCDVFSTGGIRWVSETQTNNPTYHLAGVDNTTGAWKWAGWPAINSKFYPAWAGYDTGYMMSSCWPGHGYYITNCVKNGGRVVTAGPSFVATFIGEGFDGRQCNKFVHYHESGLLIGEFGVTNGLTDVLRYGAENIPGAAGNNLATQCAEVNGVYYIYHPDESWHSGVHRWRITGMDTIQVTSFPTTTTGSANDPAAAAGDLLAGLPYNSTLANGVANWTRSPATDTSGASRPAYFAWTNALEADRFKRSIGMVSDYDGDFYIQRALPQAAAKWTFTADVWWEAWGVNVGATENDIAYIEILDGSSKVIFAFTANIRLDLNQYRLIANGTTMQSWPIDDAKGGEVYTKALRTLTVTPVDLASKTLSITYGDLTPITASIVDATSNWLAPSYLKISTHGSVGNTYKKGIAFKRLSIV